MTDDLITWLRVQLDDDERVARAAANLQADPESGWGVDGLAITPHIGVIHEDEARQHIARHDPARVLAEVDAKRRILDEHKTYDVHSGFGCGICAFNGWDKVIEPEGWCTTVRLLALPYADRPGYRSEWAP